MCKTCQTSRCCFEAAPIERKASCMAWPPSVTAVCQVTPCSCKYQSKRVQLSASTGTGGTLAQTTELCTSTILRYPSPFYCYTTHLRLSHNLLLLISVETSTPEPVFQLPQR